MSGSYHSRPAGSSDRRFAPRVPTFVEVDYRTEGTFLFTSFGARVATAPLGIFVRTEDPLPQGTQLQLHFAASSPGVRLPLVARVRPPLRGGLVRPRSPQAARAIALRPFRVNAR